MNKNRRLRVSPAAVAALAVVAAFLAPAAFSDVTPPPTHLPSDLAYYDKNQSWTKSQRAAQAAVTLATSTFTPDFSLAQHYSFALNHAACPCNIADPTNVVAGQVGMLEIDQSSTGGDVVTWGTNWKFATGLAPTLSTGANAQDYFAYYVRDTSHIIVSQGVLNAQ